MINVLVRQGFS